MYDDYHDRLFADKGNFKPQDGNIVLEVADHKITEGKIFQESDVEDVLIPAWLEETISATKPQPLLRLLLCSPEHHDNDAEKLPLPISDVSFKRIMTAWRLPTELLRMLLSTYPIATAFSAEQEIDSSPLEGLMIRSARSRDWNYCLAVVYDAATGVTNAIVQGLEQKEIEKLKDCLQQSLELAYHPMLLPVILIELKVHHFTRLLERRAEGLDAIEYETGMRHGFSERPERNKPRLERLKSRELLDFDLITQKLTGLVGTISFCDTTLKNGLESLELVKDVAEKLMHNEASSLTGGCSAMPKALYGRIDYLKALIVGGLKMGRLLDERTKAQRDTVLSLITQRDAGLNRRDSTNMRTIAAVTLIFLPGTFTATLFGAGFFNFSPKGPSRVVSSWMWLYWVITFLLTFVVLLAWTFLSRHHYQRMYNQPAEENKSSV